MIEKIAENFLYHIWDEQHLKQNLNTVNKQKVKILFQGKWNTAAGPDFRSAILIIGNEKIQGDVEIHKIENDWQHHKHHEDENYNDVILHVVFRNDIDKKFTISEDGTKIPILILQDNLDPQVNKLWKKYGGKSFDTRQIETIPCRLSDNLKTEPELLKTLSYFGKTRFKRKSKRFSAELFNSDFNQIIYKGIMEALGYSKNKIPFLKLASDFSYKKLQSFSKILNSPTELFCLLVIKSGIDLPKYNYKFINDEILDLYKKMKYKLGYDLTNGMSSSYNWNFFRLRPTNHPLYRMWQISPFLYSILNKNLANKIFSIFSVSQKKSIKYNQFKQNFYNLINKSDKKRQKVGRYRCDDIFVNIILPVGYIYAETLDYGKLKSIIKNTYFNLSKLSENYITKYIRSRLQDNIKNSRKIKLIHQQGMIQLYYRFCNHHDCENCLHNVMEKVT